jgi:hypothetical protein
MSQTPVQQAAIPLRGFRLRRFSLRQGFLFAAVSFLGVLLYLPIRMTALSPPPYSGWTWAYGRYQSCRPEPGKRPLR